MVNDSICYRSINFIFLTISLIGLITFAFCQNDDNDNIYESVQYYDQLILKGVNEAIQYDIPTNASKYNSSIDFIKEYGTFDFIIVGSGSTGSVIANRLSQNSEWKVLLLEAGQFTNNFTDIPSMSGAVMMSDYNWAYKSIPQTTTCLDMPNRQCDYPRGKGVGGSSIINALIYARGNRLDFDKWAKLGNPGWSYDEILPLFKKSENFVKNDEDADVDFEYHGQGGELNVEFHKPRNIKVNLFLEANKEKGYNILDYNGKEQFGASMLQINTRNGVREHTGNSFIKPIANKRPNLKILTETFVEKVLLQNKRAFGVKFTYKGNKYIARIRKEVILSAGALGSPQILMLSGIGPATHLQSKNIPLVMDLNVGSDLKDHPQFLGLTFTSNYTEPDKNLSDYSRDYLNGRGSLADPYNTQGIGFYQTKVEKVPNYPDLELLIMPTYGFLSVLKQELAKSNKKSWHNLKGAQAFVIIPIALHAVSTGTIRLKSNDPFEYPLIDSKFLSDPEGKDIETLYQGIQLALQLLDTKPFKRIDAKLQPQTVAACEDTVYLSKEYWYCYLRQFSSNVFHPIATCRMGPNPLAGDVVNHLGRVHGIQNLIVADASIIPFSLSGHPNAVCIMIGEKITDIIKTQYLHKK